MNTDKAPTGARATTWQPIETHRRDRYILLLDANAPAWDGNMEVGRWYGEGDDGCFWSAGGPNGGLELDSGSHGGHYRKFTHWMDTPPEPTP